MKLAAKIPRSESGPPELAARKLQIPPFGIAATAALALAALWLWSRYGVAIYLDRLAGTLWNCF